jgi:cyclopropane fatty-acyl-phospholipid synthase-like methyltransferase
LRPPDREIHDTSRILAWHRLRFPCIVPGHASFREIQTVSFEEVHVISDQGHLSDRFPRSSKYNPDWLMASTSGGANVLWLTEWLTEVVQLRPEMKVLDLACGRAASSIFLRREFGVQVWAPDLWFSAEENLQRVRDAGVEDGVFPVHADARALPYEPNFFDAIVCVDAFPYFGTDDYYLNYLAAFVKSGGPIGMAGAGLTREIEGSMPEHLREWWTQDLWCLHSAAWWRWHWEKTEIVSIEAADTMPEGWRIWLDWHKANWPDNEAEIKALEDDRGAYLGYNRVVGRRRPEAKLADQITSVPTEYQRVPLLRTEGK